MEIYVSVSFVVISLAYLAKYSVYSEVQNDLYKQSSTIFIDDGHDILQNYSIVFTSLNFHSRFKRSEHNKDKCRYFTLPVTHSFHTFCVLERNVAHEAVAMRGVKVHIYTHEIDTFKRKTYDLKDINATKAIGYDVQQPYDSYLEGYILNNSFYGRISLEHNIYYVEPLKKFQSIVKKIKPNEMNEITTEAIFYRENDIKFTLQESRYKNLNLKEIRGRFSTSQKDISHRSKWFQDKTKGRICSVILHADHTYLQEVALGSVETAVTMMLNTLDHADVIFRNADFNNDGLPDNIGFQVKHIVIQTTEHLPELRDINTPIDARDYLLSLSFNLFLQNVCIGVGFTSLRFKTGAIGLSFTPNTVDNNRLVPGGICETQVGGLQYNVLVVTSFSEQGIRIPDAVHKLTLVHELGHSFGSLHDSQNSPECAGYVMKDTSNDGSTRSHYMFSPCSKRMILRTLESRGYCLEDSNEPFCGNGLLEEGEDCDCGLDIDCLERDPCCIPRGAPYNPCRVNRGAGYSCHPSQGPCCKSNCQFRDLQQLGMNCTEMMKTCPCVRSDSSGCDCGIFGSCVEDVCHSKECTRIGLTECECEEVYEVCTSCCIHPVTRSCIPAAILTRFLVHGGKIPISSFRLEAKVPPFEVKSSIFQIVEFCYKDECANLSFRLWKKTEFCVAFGEIGTCSHGRCNISHLRNVFPETSLRSVHDSSFSNHLFPQQSIIYFCIIITFSYSFMFPS